MPTRRKTSGFTLVELMIVVFLLGIVAAVALPSFSQLVNGNRTQSAANELGALLEYSRAMALTNRGTVSVCLDKDASIWSVRSQCGKGKAIRTLEIPRGTNVAASESAIVFRNNGSAPAQKVVLCYGSDFANGYTVETLKSGMTHVYPRGTKSTDALTPMSSCNP